MRHTPAPWRKETYQIIGPDGWLIAECGPFQSLELDPDHAIADANTTLIESAPELLAACEAAAEHLNDMGCEHETYPEGLAVSCVVCVVNTAIAKATSTT